MHVHIIHQRKHRELPLRVSVRPELFKDGVVQRGHPHAAKLNSIISRAAHMANDVLLDYAGKYIQIDELRKSIAARLGHTSETVPLREFTHEIVAELESQKKAGDAYVKKNAVNAFLSYVERDILLHEIDYNTLNLYKQYLVKKQVKSSTISNYLRTLRILWNEAARRNLIKASNSPFAPGLIPFAGPGEKKAIQPIVIQSLEKIRPTLDGESRVAINSRLLQFYLQGIDIVDLALIERLWIDSDNYIVLSRFKNRSKAKQSQVRIKIQPKAQAIMSEYAGRYIIPLLDGISVHDRKAWANKRNSIDGYVERTLKKLGHYDKFGAKAVRHTWITIANSLTDNYLLPKIAAGHSVKDMTAVYIKTDQSLIDDLNARVIASTSIVVSKSKAKAS